METDKVFPLYHKCLKNW